MNMKERVERILKEATGQDLSSWEKHTFLPSIARYKMPLSHKQEAIVKKIEDKLGLGEEKKDGNVEEEENENDVPF